MPSSPFSMARPSAGRARADRVGFIGGRLPPSGFLCFNPKVPGLWREPDLTGVAMSFKLNVNGRSTTVDAPPDMPLLWVLRDLLDLKGSKFGCGIGQCGACTVHFKGSPVRSCILPVSTAAGGPITTIEGLSADGSHPLQKAWAELDVPQCGYCQAGQIMTAAALLASKPHPSDADIDGAMTGNLCRCATYLRIRAAIQKAAGPAAVAKPTK
jgi:isoquinoline 1-oxidoreductase subunit alpha